MLRVIEEASGGVLCFAETLSEAKEFLGDKVSVHSLCKYLVLDENDHVVYDTTPGISFKI